MEDVKPTLELRAKRYHEVLQAEGYGVKKPVWDAQSKTWDTWLKYEGMTMLLMFDCDDPHFVRIVAPNFWAVSPEELGCALIAADLANKQCKGGKVSLNTDRNNTFASVEFLDEQGEIAVGILIRYLDMLVTVMRSYAKAVRERRDGQTN